MEYGVMVEPQVGGTYEDLRRIAHTAEQAGFDALARSDHYLAGDDSMPATDALTSIGGLARETISIKLTVLVTPLTFRHPGVIAKTATTLDEMSNGRFELGIGTGWMESEHQVFGISLPDMRMRFSLLFETLAYVHSVFGRSDGGYVGRHFELEDVDILPRPIAKLPIIIGGMGMKKTPSIAGRFADEYNMFACDAETLAARLAVMTTSATDLGRDPSEVKVSVTSSLVVGEDEASYREALSAKAADRDKTPEELEALYAERRVLHGTYEQVAEQIAAYQAEGVGRIYLQYFEPLADVATNDLSALLAGIKG